MLCYDIQSDEAAALAQHHRQLAVRTVVSLRELLEDSPPSIHTDTDRILSTVARYVEVSALCSTFCLLQALYMSVACMIIMSFCGHTRFVR
eukprot:COSAG05_NODE_29_length_29038_cov_1237.466985_23_plen_91_part_00